MTVSPSTVPARPLLRPGTHLFPSTDGTRWFLAEPGERFTRLLGPAEALGALQPELHGAPIGAGVTEHTREDVTEDVTEIVTEDVTEGVAADLRDGLYTALSERGALTDPPDDAPTRPRILLEGSGPGADVVRRLLTSFAEVIPDSGGGDTAHDTTHEITHDFAHDFTRETTRDALGQDTCDLRITCAGWLPDHEFRALDEWSLRTATPWHHLHVEGTAIAVGPLQTPGGVRYRDWRGRRLAASTTPAELAAFWAYLASGAPLPEVPVLDPGLVAVAADLLVDDVQRWCNGWRGRSAEHVVDRSADGTLSVERHLVLPLPIP